MGQRLEVSRESVIQVEQNVCLGLNGPLECLPAWCSGRDSEWLSTNGTDEMFYVSRIHYRHTVHLIDVAVAVLVLCVAHVDGWRWHNGEIPAAIPLERNPARCRDLTLDRSSSPAERDSRRSSTDKMAEWTYRGSLVSVLVDISYPRHVS
jgi:hypothetical protein